MAPRGDGGRESPHKRVMKAKIKVRKLRGRWWVFVSGPIPELAEFKHFSDALAKVQLELRGL